MDWIVEPCHRWSCRNKTSHTWELADQSMACLVTLLHTSWLLTYFAWPENAFACLRKYLARGTWE